MRKYSLVAAAVAAALGSTASFADTTLVVAGSSAFRDAFANELSTSPTICATGTFQQFVAVAGAAPGQLASPDFRAYKCTAGSAVSGLGALTVYYRSEGGSAIGLIGNHTLAPSGLLLNQLNPNVSPLTVNETEAQLLSDTQTGAVQKLQVQLGILDVEPTAFLNNNWPGQFTVIPYAAPSKAKLATVPATKSIIGQVFAPIVSKTWASGGGNSGFFSATGLNNTEGLTSAEIATIASGAVTDWGKIPSAVAQGAPAGTPIVVCRRDAGSGTQVLTSEIFLGYNCNTGGGVGYANATGTGPNNPTPGVSAVLINYSTTDVRNCVQNNPGSIGFVALQTAAAYVGSSATQITVDGVVPSAINAASGAYKYYGEAYVVRDSTLTGGAATLANAILNDLANRNNVPTNANAPSLVAVPSSVNTAVVSPPVLGPGGTPPIAVGTTNGNSCAPFTINKL